MTTSHWQLPIPINAIVFDCDGTLSSIEGIDELAKNNGVSESVQSLTAQAMSLSGLNPSLYQQRLNLVYPKQEQVLALGQHYFAHQATDASDVIALLKYLGKSVYLVSAGLSPAVRIFGALLQIPDENIFAVDIQFDQQGNYVDFDKNSPLVNNDGKRLIVSKLKSVHQHIIHIGDGMNDFVTHDLVTRFIGYGGAFYRENMASRCQYYINTLSLAPLLPLALTQQEYESLTPLKKALYQKGLAAIDEGKVLIS